MADLTVGGKGAHALVETRLSNGLEEPSTQRRPKTIGEITTRPAELPDAGAAVAAALSVFDLALALFDASGRLVFSNRRYVDLLRNVDACSWLGQLDADLLTVCPAELEHGAEAFQAALLQSLATQGSLDVTADGRCLRLTRRSTADGGCLVTIADRTDDERRLAELSKALGLAEQANAAKSEFLCAMSHELRTPLNAVLGFGQLLQRDTKEPLPLRHRTRVEQILTAGEHLLHLIDDLLDLSRIEAGQLSMSPEPIDVRGVVQEVLTTLGPTASRADVRLALATQPSAGIPDIRADRTRFAQILMNFGSNAIKYNRANGSVIFDVSVVGGRQVRVSVSDTGLGVPPNEQETLFRPFQRAGQQRGTIEGTGMGLAICKRLAEIMQGTVGFRSVWAQGSEFWVELPVYARAPAG